MSALHTHETAVTPRIADGLLDGCGRRIDHLRISVISTCDLRCAYCRPTGEDGEAPDGAALTDAQRLDLITFLHGWYGLGRVRITGGEPLLHKGVVALIADIRRALPDLSLAMTTHGRLLYRKGFELRRAGLDRLNVSLDSLDPRRYHDITGGTLADVLAGIESAQFVGFDPPRINTVVLRGANDDEVVTLARWALSNGSEIRFLEAMPIGAGAAGNRERFVSGAEVRGRLATHFELTPLPRDYGETAQRFRAAADDCEGVIGLITPVTDVFCGQCRRIRVTADGRLFPCLLDARCVDLRAAWAQGRFQPDTAASLIEAAVHDKLRIGPQMQPTQMVALGG